MEELIQKDEAHPEKTVVNKTAEKIKEEYVAVYQPNVEQNGGAAEVSADLEAVAEVAVELSSDTSDVVNATPGKEAALQDSVEAVAVDALESSSDMNDVVNATPGKEAALQDSVEAVDEVAVESSPDTSDVINVTPGKEAALQDSVEAEAVSEVAVESSSDTSDMVNATPGKEAALQDSVEAVDEVAVESSSDTSDVINVTPGKEAALQDSAEAVDEVAVEWSSEMPAVTDAAGENAAPRVVCLDLVAHTASESPTQAAAEEPEEFIVESAAPAEPVLKPGAEEVVQCEVHPVDNPVVEQSVEPERAADHVVELTIEDAVEPVTHSDVEAALDEFSDQLIELSEALDVEPPRTEAAPEPLKDGKQSPTEENQLKQHTDDSNMRFMLWQVCSMLNRKKTGIAVKANTASQMKAKM
ncbi:hypothetical protein EYF80_001008 [Liparis tanakae]|uniref:Uncharacterized protein n=1 Tax=Liparis tanakae TaxID=230148 RepID=A0A4Z2JEL2_9TELE|nr:hypothetical protein EYF80_001008 [Liparis tanakae]